MSLDWASKGRIPGLALTCMALLCLAAAMGAPQTRAQMPQGFIDGHCHLSPHVGRRGSGPKDDYAGALETALKNINSMDASYALVMPPPFSPHMDRTYDAEEFLPALGQHSDRFGFLSGGGSLNLMIQRSVESGELTQEMKREFAERAQEILDSGAAGFGEMAAEHLSFEPGHPYEYAPPDHPLFLLLADIAAERGVPIDLHMEAVPSDMPLPPRLDSPPNPQTLKANLAAFERLLDHNPKAKIIWAHAGWGRTGQRTAQLCQRLLRAHPNLYMSIKLRRRTPPPTSMFTKNREMKYLWQMVLSEHADRFFVGIDWFHLAPGARRHQPDNLVERYGAVFRGLGPQTQRTIAFETPRELFNLN